MARLDIISVATAKQHLRVLHDDEDAVIGDYIEAARDRCEKLTGLTLTYDEGDDPLVVDPVVKQAMRMLIAGYYMDRSGMSIKARREAAETAVQSLLFNSRLTINDIREREE